MYYYFTFSCLQHCLVQTIIKGYLDSWKYSYKTYNWIRLSIEPTFIQLLQKICLGHFKIFPISILYLIYLNSQSIQILSICNVLKIDPRKLLVETKVEFVMKHIKTSLLLFRRSLWAIYHIDAFYASCYRIHLCGMYNLVRFHLLVGI